MSELPCAGLYEAKVIINFYYETTHYLLSAPVTQSARKDGEHREMTVKGSEIVPKDGARGMCLTLQIKGAGV